MKIRSFTDVSQALFAYTPNRSEAQSFARDHFLVKGVRCVLAIGRLLPDEQGRVVLRLVLSLKAGAAKVETTFETAGSFHDIHYANLGTCSSVIRPDGTLYGEWQRALRTVDNDTAIWRGISVGTYLDETEHSRTYRGALTIENAVGVLSELNGVFAVFELEIDDNGKVHHQVWALTASEPQDASS
jgi:hypothetical protein